MTTGTSRQAHLGAHLFIVAIVAIVAGRPMAVADDVSRWQQAGRGAPGHGLTSAATARMTSPTSVSSRAPSRLRFR